MLSGIPQQTPLVDGGQPTLYHPREVLDLTQGKAHAIELELPLSERCPSLMEGAPERSNLGQLTGFRIEVDLGQIPGSFPAGALDFWTPSAGALVPGVPLNVKVIIITAPLVKLLTRTIPMGIKPLIMVSIQATVSSGSQVKSSLIVLPIDLCNGCLECPCSQHGSTRSMAWTLHLGDSRSSIY